MSLNSLQNSMSHKAASMAAMAQHAKNPQEIQAMQQRLITGVQNGTIQPYVGIPLIQDLTKKLTEVKAQMAQAVTGAGMPPPPQGGAPIAQQVMQQAAQESQGVEALPSNLPQSYAGGGIIAFEEGGPVQRLQVGGMGNVSVPYSATNPNAAFGDFLKQLGMSTSEYANARPEAQKSILDMFNSQKPAAPTMGPSVTPTPAATQTMASEAANTGRLYNAGKGLGSLVSKAPKLGPAIAGAEVLGNLGSYKFQEPGLDTSVGGVYDALKQGNFSQAGRNLVMGVPEAGLDVGRSVAGLGDYVLPGQPLSQGMDRALKSYFGDKISTPSDVKAAPPPAPASGADQYDPNTATRRSMYTNQPYSAAPAAPVIPGSNFKMPTLPTMKETAAPTLTDYSKIIGDMPEKTKAASEAAVKAAQSELEGFDKPGFDIREEKLGKREAGLDKDIAINRALGLISTGLGVAGSKERTLAGALGNEGRQGIADLIRGEAANRAAKDRLDDARDNFEQQKIQAKKGNYQAAQQAGNRAADDLRAGTQLTMTGAHFGNTEALTRYQTQQQGEFQKASLGQSGALGLAGLNLQSQHLAQQGALGRAQLDMQAKRFAALDKASQARLDQVRVNAFNGFNKDVAPTINAQLVKQYGPNWQTAKDPRSLEAQMVFKQYRDAHIMDALGKHDERMSYGRSADELLQ